MYCQWIKPIICKDNDEKAMVWTGCIQRVGHEVYTIRFFKKYIIAKKIIQITN